MSDWTLTVVTPSKTFALPTSRVAFATTTNRASDWMARTDAELSSLPADDDEAPRAFRWALATGLGSGPQRPDMAHLPAARS